MITKTVKSVNNIKYISKNKKMNETKVVYRTARIWLRGNDMISYLCHTSKNLYNEANYLIRQELFKNGKWLRYNQLCEILKNSENYKELPAQTAQQTLKIVDTIWKSFFNGIKEWKLHQYKFLSKPKIPHYKRKDGEFTIVFTNQQARIKNGIIIFPRKVGLTIKAIVKKGLKEVRIVPKGIGYILEVVYEKSIDVIKRNKQRMVGIDLGVKNIITMVNNIGEKPIIVKDGGTGVKSINQYYNKKKAVLQSIYELDGIKDGNKIKHLQMKRDKKVYDYVHKLSKFIVDWCKHHNIGTIVFGYNMRWKQKVGLGKKNNQNFVQIPFNEIIEKTMYKAEERSIDVIKQNESYTSKCSFLDNEPVEHRNVYIGKRIKRGLFRSGNGKVINADVNAGYNILEKAIPGAIPLRIREWIGECGLHPVRCLITSHGGV